MGIGSGRSDRPELLDESAGPVVIRGLAGRLVTRIPRPGTNLRGPVWGPKRSATEVRNGSGSAISEHSGVRGTAARAAVVAGAAGVIAYALTRRARRNAGPEEDVVVEQSETVYVAEEPGGDNLAAADLGADPVGSGRFGSAGTSPARMHHVQSVIFDTAKARTMRLFRHGNRHGLVLARATGVLHRRYNHGYVAGDRNRYIPTA